MVMKAPAATKLPDRFWVKVDESRDGCWLWNAGSSESGYGIYNVKGIGRRKAHRLSLIDATVESSLLALHKCDVKICVRPSHLYWGTYSDNANDYWLSSASDNHRSILQSITTGELHHASKLTDQTVIEARRLYKNGGVSYRDLARKYSVDPKAIYRAIKGQTWRHV